MDLKGNGIWNQIIRKKYLKNLTVEDWLWNKKFTTRGTFHFWNGFIRTLTWITKLLGWKAGNGLRIKLGVDLIIGLDSFHILLEDLREYSKDYGLLTLQDAQNMKFGLNRLSYWITSKDLELGGRWKAEWDFYIKELM